MGVVVFTKISWVAWFPHEFLPFWGNFGDRTIMNNNDPSEVTNTNSGRKKHPAGQMFTLEN